MDTIIFDNKEYPLKDIFFKGSWITVATETLSKALNPNDDWDEITEEAERVDNEIYFYLPDEVFAMDNKTIKQYVKDNS